MIDQPCLPSTPIQSSFSLCFSLSLVFSFRTIWSVLMPLQYWDSFRKQYPAVHRICGYAVALCATVLSFSGLAFIPWELSYSASTFTLHTIYGYPILPTFNAGGIAVAPVLLYTGVRAVYLARHKRFAEHRRWTVYHGITGYLISIQRVWMIVVNILGAILDKSVALQRFLGTDQLHGLKTISDSELSAMAFTTWAAIFTSLGWWYYLHQSNAIKKGKSIRLH